MTAVLDVNVSTTGTATGARLLLAAQTLAWHQRPPGKFIAMTLKPAVAERWSSVARHRAHHDLSAEQDLMGEQIRG